MFKSKLMAAMLGFMGGVGHVSANHDQSAVRNGKKRRRVDHFRNRLKHTHSGYPGAKLERKVLLGEVGGRHPR